jgi:hypothetical protein
VFCGINKRGHCVGHVLAVNANLPGERLRDMLGLGARVNCKSSSSSRSPEVQRLSAQSSRDCYCSTKLSLLCC